jgi:hypothetical protein
MELILVNARVWFDMKKMSGKTLRAGEGVIKGNGRLHAECK